MSLLKKHEIINDHEFLHHDRIARSIFSYTALVSRLWLSITARPQERYIFKNLSIFLPRASQQHAKQVSNLDREVEQQMEKLETKIRQEVSIEILVHRENQTIFSPKCYDIPSQYVYLNMAILV